MLVRHTQNWPAGKILKKYILIPGVVRPPNQKLPSRLSPPRIIDAYDDLHKFLMISKTLKQLACIFCLHIQHTINLKTEDITQIKVL